MQNVLAIVDSSHDDGSLHPVIGDEGFPIELEPLDGRPELTVAKMLGEGIAFSQLRAKVTKIKADVIITDARVAVGCRKFEKGGGWIGIGGGAVTAAALNAVSKARAAHHRKGKMLVAQVRYAWLSAVLFQEKTKWYTDETLILGFNRGNRESPNPTGLFMQLPKDMSSALLAKEIAHRAATYRLAHDEVTDDGERRTLEQLVAADGPTTAVGSYQAYGFPTFRFANSGTAYPREMRR